MKIRTRIHVSIILCIVLTVAISSFLYTLIREMHEESEEAKIADVIVKDIAELNIVAHEYLLFPGKRSLAQWNSKYASLAKRLAAKEGVFDNLDEMIILNKTHENLVRLRTVFSDLTMGFVKEQNSGKSTISTELQDRLAGELLINSQTMISPIFYLQKKIQDDVEATQKKTSSLILTVLLVFMSVVVGILLWINKSIAKPIVILEKGIKDIGQGAWGHKVGTDAKDEIGQLSRAFDKMTNDLKETTVSKLYVENIINSMIDPLMVVTPEGLIQSANQATYDLLGYQAEELIGQSMIKILIEEEGEEEEEEEVQKIFQKTGLQKLVKKGYIKGIERTYLTKDGDNIPVLFSGSVMRESGGRIQGIICLASDISELRQVEEEREILISEKNERVKELTCLYEISKSIRMQQNLNDFFQDVLKYIPSGCQYPELTCCRLGFKGETVISENFQETGWKISSDINISGKKTGELEVFHLKEIPDHQKGPFLKEERNMINGISQLISETYEHRQALEMLKSERDKLQGVLNGMGKGMYIVNQDLVIEYNNSVIESRFPDTTGKKCHTVFFNSDEPCKFCSMQAAVKGGKILQTEAIMPNDNYYDIVFSPFTDIDGRVKTIVLMRDITEMKTLQAEAIRAGNLAALGELAAGVAHEINNPLNGIISCAEILRDQFDEQGEDDEIPIRIIDTGNRVARIVKNLLNLARDHKEEHSPAIVKDILSDTLTLVEKQVSKDGIKLSVDIPADLPKIKAHGHEIQQVFLNCISNARYAVNNRIQNSHAERFIKIKAGIIEIEDMKYIRIIFHDNGSGIPENVLEKICNPFFTTKPAGEGTGLGLNISHEIITNHDGRLWFESVEGEFAKAIVELPVYRG